MDWIHMSVKNVDSHYLLTLRRTCLYDYYNYTHEDDAKVYEAKCNKCILYVVKSKIKNVPPPPSKRQGGEEVQLLLILDLGIRKGNG
jgi:hypothetical protein